MPSPSAVLASSVPLGLNATADAPIRELPRGDVAVDEAQLMHGCQGPGQPPPEPHDLLHRQLLADVCVLREICAQGSARQVIEDQVFGAFGSSRVVEGYDVVVPAGQRERFGFAACSLRIAGSSVLLD
jgi:hypothetical protein